MLGGDVDLVDYEENSEVAWCTLDEVYQHFEELARIPDGMYKPLSQYLERDAELVDAAEGVFLRIMSGARLEHQEHEAIEIPPGT